MKGKIVAMIALFCSAPAMAQMAYSPPTEECRSSPFRPWASCDTECPGLFAKQGVVFDAVRSGVKINGKTCDARPRQLK